jgi:hypothetical protein
VFHIKKYVPLQVITQNYISKKQKMKEQSKELSEELVSYVFNPLRIERMSEKHKLDMESYIELL